MTIYPEDYICYVHPDNEEDLREVMAQPSPIAYGALIDWLLQKNVGYIPYKGQMKRMESKPAGFVWTRKPWKAMALLSGVKLP